MKRVVGAMIAVSLVAGGTGLWWAVAGPDRARATGAGRAPATGANPVTGAGPAAASQVAFVPDPIEWFTCWENTLREGVFPGVCGYLTVPLDYADPAGAKIEIAVTKIEHTSSAAEYQGVMLVNPGGPGAQGIAMPLIGKEIPHQAGLSYDWIGFDPRGVGFSRPRLSCDESIFAYARPPYRPTTQKQESVWLERSKAYAEACARSGGGLLEHVKTVDTVNDMDSLRKALGREQINFYGTSYGTELGQVYSTMYPSRVRRMVFDGITDPRLDSYQANLAQNAPVEKAMRIYFAWVAKYHSVYRLGDTEAKVRKNFEAQRAELTRKPAGGTIGVDEWDDLFIRAGYAVSRWEELTKLFAGYANEGKWKPLKSKYDEYYPQAEGWDNDRAMYLATECTDSPWPKDWATWERDHRASYQKAPFMAWLNAWFNAPCLFWPAEAGRPVAVDGRKVPGILLISETFDGATPFAGALEVRRRYPRSSLVEGVGGSTHAGTVSGVPCTDNIIAAYLADGALPARLPGDGPDRKCPPIAQPDPRPASAN